MFAKPNISLDECVVTYDGTYEGLLTVVFECYRLKLAPTVIKPSGAAPKSLFTSQHPIEVTTDNASAKRVVAGIRKYGLQQAVMDIYKTFLSEDSNREMVIFGYLRLLFSIQKPINTRYHVSEVLRVSQLVKQMRREVHRMHAFVRFQELADGLFFAPIEPDFDVLPVTYQHFKARYASMQWCIYDIKRDYGVLYNGQTVEEVKLEEAKALNSVQLPAALLSGKEQDYQQLWRDYFNSTNIIERKNIKLHLRHVPTRYWKYLTEKQ